MNQTRTREKADIMLSAVKNSRILRARVAIFVLLGLFCGTGGAFAKEKMPASLKKLVEDYSVKGFKLRKERWNGSFEVSESQVVKHQLFRGNEYWFLAAVSDNKHSIKVEVFDELGQAVSLERFMEKGVSGARVLPEKTGAYLIKLTLESKLKDKKERESLEWTLVYGYR